jgi:diguanylate cyclase (GGDEF)-like protein
MRDKNLSIMMIDIDYFKDVNDTYGHIAGDEVLKEFSSIISNNIRRDLDWVARFGGEEFLVCLPGASTEKAAEIAESIRKAVESHTFIYLDKRINITSSFGVAGMESGMHIETLIESADKYLYMAKQEGRNKVEYLNKDQK